MASSRLFDVPEGNRPAASRRGQPTTARMKGDRLDQIGMLPKQARIHWTRGSRYPICQINEQPDQESEYNHPSPAQERKSDSPAGRLTLGQDLQGRWVARSLKERSTAHGRLLDEGKDERSRFAEDAGAVRSAIAPVRTRLSVPVTLNRLVRETHWRGEHAPSAACTSTNASRLELRRSLWQDLELGHGMCRSNCVATNRGIVLPARVECLQSCGELLVRRSV